MPEWIEEDICIHFIDYDKPLKERLCKCARGEKAHYHHKLYPSR